MKIACAFALVKKLSYLWAKLPSGKQKKIGAAGQTMSALFMHVPMGCTVYSAAVKTLHWVYTSHTGIIYVKDKLLERQGKLLYPCK